MGDLLENDAEPMESQDMFDDDPDEIDMSQPDEDSDYVLSQNQEEIVKAFQNFVQQTGENLDFEVSDVLSNEFEKYRDKLKLLEAISSGVDAVLKAVCAREDQKIDLWEKFMESGIFKGRLGA